MPRKKTAKTFDQSSQPTERMVDPPAINRSMARKLWQDVANGYHLSEHYGPFDLVGWLQDVANAVLAADSEDGNNARLAKLVEAIGLGGRLDPHDKLRDYVEHELIAWEFWDSDSGEPEPTRAQMVDEIFRGAKAKGLLRGVYADYDDVDEKPGRDLIRKLMSGRAKQRKQ